MAGEIEIDLHGIRHLVIAGWTGADIAAVEHHIRELEAIGIKRPKSTPVFYRAAASLLTTADMIEVLGESSSGEAECVVYNAAGRLLVGAGSDHTDRELEKIGVSLSKQICPKPVSRQVWPFEEVSSHWDRLILRSFAHVEGKRCLYQEGLVSSMRPPPELISLFTGGKDLAPGTAMFCGTLAVHGGIRAAEVFEIEIEDPVRGRKIAHRYSVNALPIEG